MLRQFVLWWTCIRDEFVSQFFLIWCRKFLWSQFFITFELKFKHSSSYFDKSCSMLIIWMQAPFNSTLTGSQSVAVNAFITTGNLVLVFQMWFDYCRKKQSLVTVCAEQLQKCHAPAPHSPVNKELSLLFLFLAQHKPTDLLLCACTAPRTSELFLGDHWWQQSQYSLVRRDWQFVSQLQFKWRKIAMFAPLWIILGFVSE